MQDESPTNENRSHKDSLFVDYFSKDREWKQHFLSLYNALHGTNLQVADTTLERVNIDQVLYKSYYNDIAVLVDGQFILMIEHQSTVNPNMPLRLLEYIWPGRSSSSSTPETRSCHQKATCTYRTPSRTSPQTLT